MNGRSQIFVGRAIALTVALIASPVAAHPGHEAMGVGAGLIHPLTGIDHFMAMIAIGLLAAKQRTAPVWSLPLAFVVMMMIGMMAGSATGSGTGTEITIAACLILAGLALMTGRDMPLLPGAVLAAVSGFAHGMAHAIDNAGSVLQVQFVLGALAMTAILHISGALGGRAILRLPERLQNRGWQGFGLAAAATGAMMVSL